MPEINVFWKERWLQAQPVVAVMIYLELRKKIYWTSVKIFKIAGENDCSLNGVDLTRLKNGRTKMERGGLSFSSSVVGVIVCLIKGQPLKLVGIFRLC